MKLNYSYFWGDYSRNTLFLPPRKKTSFASKKKNMDDLRWCCFGTELNYPSVSLPPCSKDTGGCWFGSSKSFIFLAMASFFEGWNKWAAQKLETIRKKTWILKGHKEWSLTWDPPGLRRKKRGPFFVWNFCFVWSNLGLLGDHLSSSMREENVSTILTIFSPGGDCVAASCVEAASPKFGQLRISLHSFFVFFLIPKVCRWPRVESSQEENHHPHFFSSIETPITTVAAAAAASKCKIFNFSRKNILSSSPFFP